MNIAICVDLRCRKKSVDTRSCTRQGCHATNNRTCRGSRPLGYSLEQRVTFSTRFCDFEDTDTWLSLPVQLIRASQPNHIPISRCSLTAQSMKPEMFVASSTSSDRGGISPLPSGSVPKKWCSMNLTSARKQEVQANYRWPRRRLSHSCSHRRVRFAK